MINSYRLQTWMHYKRKMQSIKTGRDHCRKPSMNVMGAVTCLGFFWLVIEGRHVWEFQASINLLRTHRLSSLSSPVKPRHEFLRTANQRFNVGLALVFPIVQSLFFRSLPIKVIRWQSASLQGNWQTFFIQVRGG